MSDRKVGFLGTPGRIAGSAFLDTPKLLSSVGANTGNLVFQYAVNRSIAEDKLYVGTDVPWDAAEVRARCRVLVIPSANFIRENFDLTGFVAFLKKTDLPLVFVGLGVQADSFEKNSFDLHPSICSLIGLLRERCRIVGVRGEFTAQVLSDFGIDKLSVIGCPSNFLNPDQELHRKLADKWHVNESAIATTGDEPWPKDLRKRDAERKLVDIARASGGLYVQQSVEPFVLALRRHCVYQSIHTSAGALESLRSSIAPSMSVAHFEAFLTSTVRLYFDVDQWLQDLSRFNLSLGLRLHGNMVAFQAGCPAIWIHHDARTKELADTMCLPSVSINEFLRSPTTADLKTGLDVDWERYADRRNQLWRRYEDILVGSGIAFTR
jgi:hypothetical protein